MERDVSGRNDVGDADNILDGRLTEDALRDVIGTTNGNTFEGLGSVTDIFTDICSYCRKLLGCQRVQRRKRIL